MRKPKASKKNSRVKNNKDSFYYDPNLPIDQVLKNLFQKNSENFTHDFISYRIFIVQPELTSRFEEDTKTIDNFNNELFFEKSCEIHQFLKERIPENYIWQGDIFNVTFVSPLEQLGDCAEEMYLRNRQPIYPYICGRVNFSETNIDEWFITYLLVELSKNFKDQVVVQISDQDGEFLLIEAADHIAEWMNDEPELTTNRVFIYNGMLHILPEQPTTPSYSYYEVFPISKPIQNIHKAVEMISRESKYCKSDEAIQNCISTRLSTFPKEATEFGSQKIGCYLPIDVIRLLDKHPQIISKCIYYLTRKNNVTEKFLKSFSRFLPSEPSSDSVGSIRDHFTYYSANVNRCQYVQLISSRLNVNEVPKLAPIYKPNNKRTDKQEKAYELGFQILCGLEMYYHAEKPIDSFDSFEDYVDHLYDHGYFGLEMSGTDKFNDLLTKSKTYYDEFGKTAKCYFIEQVLREGSTLTMKEIKQRKLIVDSDDWLESANEEMDKYFAQKGFTESGEEQVDIEKKAKDMMDKVKSFIEEEESNISGVKSKPNKTNKDDWSFVSSSSTAPNDQSRLEKFLKETFGKYPMEELIEKFNVEEEVDEDNEEDNDDEDEWEDEELIDPEMEDLMQKMDNELYQFGDTQQRSEITDANVMKNLLKSLQAQGSEYGPTSVLLQHLGLDVPYFEDDEE